MEFAAFYLCLAVAAAFFGYVGYQDFTEWKIRNKSVLILCGLYAVTAMAGMSTTAIMTKGFINPTTDLYAGGLLFAMGFVFWALKWFGAGDAKLLFPTGLFVGWDHMMLFTIGLLVFAILFLVVLKSPFLQAFSHTRIGFRIHEIASTRKTPYGVVIVLALYVVMYARFVPAF
ncbi:prepilin peptidase [Roseibium sp.]|uniref:prepilin peptidase n=1 Tax=Roseibium sp. TaxID=1936156 RepID=UPI003D1286B6